MKKTLERKKKRMRMHTDEERTRKRGEQRGGPSTKALAL
jgi:hypothetical protein